MNEDDEPTVGDPDAAEVDESGRNLTQQRLDEDDEETSAPADVPWEGEEPPAGDLNEAEAEERGAW